MMSKVLILCCYALTLFSCNCQDSALEPDASRSMRQVDGEGSDFEVSGKSGSSKSDFHSDLKLACTHSIEDFREVAQREDLKSVVEPLSKVLKANPQEYFVHTKLHPNHHGSICQNLNVTCCKPNLEKMTETLVRDEYKFYYNEIFREHTQTCISPGKRLLKSSIQVLGVLIQQVEVRVNESLAGTLPHGMFTALKNYMISFVTTSATHICPLPGILQELTDSLIQVALDSIFDTDEDYNYIMADPESVKCMLNVSAEIVEDQRGKIQSSLERQLEDVSLLSQSLDTVRGVVDVMRRHSFSSSCLTGLVRMRYCPLCGAYGLFKPCLFMCINTLQGCFADLAEIRSDFVELTTAMRELADDIEDEFSPNIFAQSYMNQFVLMVQELRAKQDELKESLLSECSKSTNGPPGEITRTRRSGTLFQPIQGAKNQPKLDPLLEQLDPTQLTTVIKVEMGCLDRIADKMMGISEEICTLDTADDAIAHKGNTLCWTGTTMGRYEHPKAGLLKQDQLKNPAYSDIPMTTDIRYASLIGDIRTMSQKINAILSFNKLCEQSDDEDCYRDSYRNCGTAEPPTGTEPSTAQPSSSGSGSGSGSGSNSGSDITDDTERPSSSTGVFFSTPATTEGRRNTDTSTFGNELADGMIPQPNTVVPSRPGTTTTELPSVQDGFDNSIPGYKDIKNPTIATPPKPVDPVESQTDPTNTHTPTDTANPSPEDRSGGVTVTTISDTQKTAQKTDEAVTSKIVVGSFDIRDPIPTISSSASLHTRLLNSVFILCSFVFLFLH